MNVLDAIRVLSERLHAIDRRLGVLESASAHQSIEPELAKLVVTDEERDYNIWQLYTDLRSQFPFETTNRLSEVISDRLKLEGRQPRSYTSISSLLIDRGAPRASKTYFDRMQALKKEPPANG